MTSESCQSFVDRVIYDFPRLGGEDLLWQLNQYTSLDAYEQLPDLPKLEFDWHHNLVPVDF